MTFVYYAIFLMLLQITNIVAFIHTPPPLQPPNTLGLVYSCDFTTISDFFSVSLPVLCIRYAVIP